MILIKEDETEIRKELRKLEIEISFHRDPDFLFSSAISYLDLAELYLLTNPMDSNMKLYHSLFLQDSREKSEELEQQYIQNYIDNKKIHGQMISAFYQEINEQLINFYKSVEYNKAVLSQKETNLKQQEDFKLLISFFQEEDPSLKEQFLDMIKQNRFYVIKEETCLGATTYNSIENTCNIFLQKESPTIDSLATIVHEMGHVIDFLDIGKHFEILDRSLYSRKSIYCEVLSILYEQKFLNFLIQNNIRKEQASLCLICSYIDNFIHFPNLIAASKLSSLEIKSLCKGLMSNQELQKIFGSAIFYNPYLFDLRDSLAYSYGLLLANHLMEDKKKEKIFMELRNDFFDPNQLEKLDITVENSGLKLIKRLERTMNNMINK